MILFCKTTCHKSYLRISFLILELTALLSLQDALVFASWRASSRRADDGAVRADAHTDPADLGPRAIGPRE